MTRTTKGASSAVAVAALTHVLVSQTTPADADVTTTIGLKDLGLWEPKRPRRKSRMAIFVDLTWRQAWYLFWIEAVLTALLIYALVRIL